MNEPQVFSNVFAIYNHLKSKGWNIPMYTAPCFEVMELYGNHVAAVPMPMMPLFRGENSFHSPCRPSLHRREWTKLELMEREIQLSDFESMLQVHPEVKEMISTGLYVNYTGMAQHYGISTNILDLTNSFLVAAFFATTTYDELTDSYRPILSMLNQGVIYFLSIGSLFNDKIWPIGQEAIRRPGEQRGFGISLDNDDDFNTQLGVMSFKFWQDRNTSLKIWNETRGGSIFFPYDPMAEKVRIMKKYRIYSENALRNAYEKFQDINMSFEEVKVCLINKGCTFTERLPFAYTPKEIDYIKAEFYRMYPNDAID